MSDMGRLVSDFSRHYTDIVSELSYEGDEHAGRYLNAQLPRYKMIIKEVYSHIVDGLVLDVGVYPGVFTCALKRMGVNIQAVDLESKRISDSINECVSVKDADIEYGKLPFDDESMDVVLFLAVIEHLRVNPLVVLREFNRILRPGGRLILQTPNLGYWRCRLDVLMGKSFDESPFAAYDRLERLGHPGHIRVYTMSELVEIMCKTGFNVQQSIYFNNDSLEQSQFSRKRILDGLFGIIPSMRRQLLTIGEATKNSI